MFNIPKSPLSNALTAASLGGEVATIIYGKVRDNTPKRNPYLGRIKSGDISDTGVGVSELGTIAYADVTFDSVTYTDRNGNQITTPRMNFQAIIVSVTFPRNIVKTEIQGRDGTVKEYIGEGDAQVSFSGVIVGSNGHYPSDETAALNNIIKAPVPIPVICSFLQNLDIDSVVFEGRTIGQQEGGYSYQTFSLNAISDIPQELQINGI